MRLHRTVMALADSYMGATNHARNGTVSLTRVCEGGSTDRADSNLGLRASPAPDAVPVALGPAKLPHTCRRGDRLRTPLSRITGLLRLAHISACCIPRTA